MADYPTTVPIAQIMEVISIVRAGEVAAKAPAFAHDLWEIQGYGQGILIGSPAAPVTSPQFNLVTQSVVEADVLVTLDKVVAAHNSGGAQSLVDWVPIVLWVSQQLFDLLKSRLGK